MNERLIPLLLLVACYYGAVFCCVVADLISGLRKARKNSEKCSSWGLRRTVDKLSRYYLSLFGLTAVDAMLIASMLMLDDKAPFLAFPYLTTVGAVSLGLIEIKSILETADEKRDLRRTASELLKKLREI